MSGATHKVGGLCTGVLASALLLKTPSPEGVFLSSILIAGSYLGSLMPDIDHKGSTVGHKVKLISGTISKLFGHRGITHAPLFHLFIAGLMFLFVNSLETGILGLILTSFVIGLFLGGLNHLFLDMLTMQGIPLFYPLSNKKINLLRLKTGHPGAEATVKFSCIGVTVIGIAFMFLG